ncbi:MULTISPECIES: glycosyltransferase [unclassified Anoxybacillus]|uniref:glycosyltransferase family 2 protein n=1 Tax=unclassified Anoxybacillus TaxID=2639704 RepID=UPI001EDBADB8|nr:MULTISPECIES: glycosyltransferase [unclassified Anoxybacillus]MCG5025316.1 glycosyltransferase [Anoxybacillus flavithermus]MCG6195726.1 glycosyltransferase [Anoxybacillus sp. LAT_38]MCG3083675.1 glycosyltransferase [Anoxybacillus sp. LAT27]MCG6175283.1 glycosyltransferase [Anoxybacillus sp. LAT_31]MCG6179340.1 glycosyltransferase [Anoxybacillus sp. LAT_33]
MIKLIAMFVFFFMIAVILFYTFLLIVSLIQLRRMYELDDWEPYEEMLDVSYTKPVSILVPAYNEEAGIFATVRSLLSIEYPEYEIVVINDGSTDDTLERLKQDFDLVEIKRVIRQQLKTKPIRAVYRSRKFSHLFVIDKDNGGKADALNAGINFSSYPYVCSIDGDSVIERRAFLKVMKPIIDSDEDIIASGGSVRIANGCDIEKGEVIRIALSRQPLVVMQVIEYLRAFLMGRIGLSRHNLLLIVSGAFGVFSKQWVIRAGGYAHTVGEDMELVVRLHRMIKETDADKKIVYVPDPVCWTEAPESLSDLRKQRRRWHRGLFESLWLHRRMWFNPRYGTIGLISMPYFLLIEFLGPVVELVGYILVIVALILGDVYIEFAILLFLVSVLYGSLFSMAAVLLEEWTVRKFPNVSDIVRLFFYSLTETLWYRPLTVLWRCEGIVDALLKRKGWGEMKRKGVSK